VLTVDSSFVNVRQHDLKVNVFDSFKHAIQSQAPDRVLPHITFELHCVPVVCGMHLQIHVVVSFVYGDLLAALCRITTPCSFVGC